MKDFIVGLLAQRRYKKLLKRWRGLAMAYRDMGESDHWIRARITEYVEHKDSDDSIQLKTNQTKEDYIEEILKVLHESKTMSGPGQTSSHRTN